jgi:adenosine deaminase
MRRQSMQEFIRGLPKAELHVHLEGTLEPEMLVELARRNGIRLRFPSVEALRRAYRFRDLRSFLELYYEGAAVLVAEADFHDLTCAYLDRARRENVRYAEIFFDPQSHTRRGVPLATVIGGIHRACEAYRARGIDARLILCFLRDLGARAAMATLEQALPFRDRLVGVGLDSAEVGHPPREFVGVFARARTEGLHVVAHAGEEGPPAYVWEALDFLGAERIDHGVRAIEDAALLDRLAREAVPLTVCPLSNVMLGVVPAIAAHPVKRLLDAGVRVTINSDDPAYFGGYLNENYLAVQRAFGLDHAALHRLAVASFEASFLPEPEKRAQVRAVDAYASA